jgi:hypothetical protein
MLRKSLENRTGLIQHLKSPAHMDAQLRCPGCLRQYASATALVQHAESQAIRCQIRDSNEYKMAVNAITGGFVDTAGRHEDDTIRYVAPDDVLDLGKGGHQARVAAASDAFWKTEEEKRKKQMEYMAENAKW